MSALTRPEQARNDVVISPFDDLFRRFLRAADWTVAPLQEMRLDVSENDKEYVVKAEIPGARKEDIQVKVDRGYVSISAELKNEKKEERKDDDHRVLLQEMRWGTVKRAFTLAAEVDPKETTAKYDNGVLMLTLPKRAPSSSKTVAVQ